MADVRFTQTLNGAASNVVERHPLASLLPVTVQPQAPRENPAKGLRKLIKVWEKTPQARPLLSVLRGVVLGPDFTPDRTQSIPADFFPEALVDHKDVQLVIGRGGTIVLLAADSPRRGAGTIREAMRSGRRIVLTGPRGGLAPAQREALDTSAFAVVRKDKSTGEVKKSWPLHDEAHAKIALNYMKRGFGRKSDYPHILDEIERRYPHLLQSSPRVLTNPARSGEDFQDPNKTQFRRVFGGILRSQVRRALKARGYNLRPLPREMTAADYAYEKRLLTELNQRHPEDIAEAYRSAWSIATGKERQAGRLVPGTQTPTAAGEFRSTERMVDEENRFLKDDYYEFALGLRRKSGAYRVVSRQYGTPYGVEERHYVFPSRDPNNPTYYLDRNSAEAAVASLNARALRNPGDDIDFDDLDFGIEDEPKATPPRQGRASSTPRPSPAAAAPTGSVGKTEGTDLEDDNAAFTEVEIEDDEGKMEPLTPGRERIVRQVITNITRASGGSADVVMTPGREKPFYDIQRRRLVPDHEKPARFDGTPAKKYVNVAPSVPFDPEVDRLFYEIYVPTRILYSNALQRGTGGNPILVPEKHRKTDLMTRFRGRGEERRTEDVAKPYSEAGKALSRPISVNRLLFERYFSPYGSVEDKWASYAKAKAQGGRKNKRTLMNLIPRPSQHIMPARRSDPMVKLKKGQFNERTGQYENKVSDVYQKFYTTNPEIFRNIVLFLGAPGLQAKMSRLDSLIQDAQRASGSLEPEEVKVREEGDWFADLSDIFEQALSTASAPTGLVSSPLIPSTKEITEGLRFLNASKGPDSAVIPVAGGWTIPGFGSSRVVFPNKAQAVAWLTLHQEELPDLYKGYLSDRRAAAEPVSPITVTGVPFSAGEAAPVAIARLFEPALRASLGVGQTEARAQKEERRAARLQGEPTERAKRQAAAAEEAARVAELRAQQDSARKLTGPVTLPTDLFEDEE
jgi:hypothetical protein